MMKIELNEENTQEITAPVSITLPKFAWLAITARANVLFNGDIDACCQDIFMAGLDQKMAIFAVEMEPDKTPEPNAPGGSA